MNDQKSYNFRNILLLSAACVLVMFAVSGYVWFQIPDGEQVCIHWNALGECDGYGSKFMGIFLMPLITLVLSGLLLLLPRIDPRALHLAQSRKAYMVVWATLLLFFLALHGLLMIDLLGGDANISLYMPLLLGLMFIVIGSYLGKVRSNFFFGIRTPWTLSSELAWEKTHQLGGKLFILLGALLMVGSIIFTGPLWVALLLGGVFMLVFFLMGYSYYIWKSDPDAHSR